MLTITLLYMIVPFILCAIYCYLFRSSKKMVIKSLIWLLIFLVVRAIEVYFMLPSRNLLSITIGNAFWGLIYGALCYPYYTWKSSSTNPIYKIRKKLIPFISIVGVLLVAGLIGEIHSVVSVKPTWQSISKEYSKSSEAPTFKRNETPVALTPTTVLNRVHKAASDIPNSQYYDVSDNVQAQFYKGKPVYIIPVEYSGFWAMNKAHEVPGYFIIDATSQNASPKFIKHSYKYATSAYFGKDASRQIYRHVPEWLELGDPQLEIDDNGSPYWVQTIYKPEFFSHRINYSELHVAVLDAKTGDVKVYSVDSMPRFIDVGITTEAANQMNWNFGKYKYGYWNWSKTGVMKPTGNGVEDGVTSVFNRDGSISYFTDFTTDKTGSDSALGYSMINARTGKLTFYRANNIMDSDGAKNNANQDYKAQQWKAYMPILYNVNSHPTWVMTILDSTHAIRGYYYLDASDQSVYGTGSTPTSALDAFRQALVNNGSAVGNTNSAKAKAVKGTVDRVAVVSSQNKVMFTLKGSKTIYTVNTNDFNFANLVRPNDKVEFKASIVEGKRSIGNVSHFKDKALN